MSNMKSRPSLVVLAAGMGSRYGALKQMDDFGPNGETLIDYSIYDAIEAGFEKVVFIVREHFKNEFKSFFDRKFGEKVELHYATQELHNIPYGKSYHKERKKPWGTAHAIYVAKNYIQEPFAVINADDYYGRDAYKVSKSFFDNSDGEIEEYAVVGYRLKNTLSEHGTVNRGVCYQDSDGYLKNVVECTKIGIDPNGTISYPGENEVKQKLDPETLVSMNLWAFYPSYFEYCEAMFKQFLDQRGMELTSEFFIPLLVDELIQSKTRKVKVLTSEAKWFGVTYKEDKPIVMSKIQQLIHEGVYPSNLWS